MKFKKKNANRKKQKNYLKEAQMFQRAKGDYLFYEKRSVGSSLRAMFCCKFE